MIASLSPFLTHSLVTETNPAIKTRSMRWLVRISRLAHLNHLALHLPLRVPVSSDEHILILEYRFNVLPTHYTRQTLQMVPQEWPSSAT